MSNITITAVPGEAAIVAICNLIQTIVEGQTPEQKKILWEQHIALITPWQNIIVEINKDLAGFIKSLRA